MEILKEIEIDEFIEAEDFLFEAKKNKIKK